MKNYIRRFLLWLGFEMDEQTLMNLPRAKDHYVCPKCDEYLLMKLKKPIAQTKSEFKEWPDPHLQWWEAHQCPECKTILRISNGT